MGAPRSTLLVALLVAHCGPGEPARSVEPTRTPERAASDEPGSEPAPARGPTARRVAASTGIEVQGEVGGLEQEAVDRVVGSANGDIDACWAKATERNELVSGTVQLVIGVGGQGRSVYAFVKQSSLGDARAERCLLDALSSKGWPKPVGGKVGVVRTSLAFELPKGTRGPTPWASGRVSDVLATAASELSACKKGVVTPFTATVYVKQVELPPPPADADAGDAGDAADAGPVFAGAAISVGVAASDEKAAAASECLERLLSQASYPAPGEWPAKVTFEL